MTQRNDDSGTNDRELASVEPAGRELSALDKLVHEPHRFAILHVLARIEKADYAYLQRITGLTMGALAAHIGRLEDAGLIEVRKEFVLRRPKTWVLATQAGERAVEEHWQRLEKIRSGTSGKE